MLTEEEAKKLDGIIALFEALDPGKLDPKIIVWIAKQLKEVNTELKELKSQRETEMIVVLEAGKELGNVITELNKVTSERDALQKQYVEGP